MNPIFMLFLWSKSSSGGYESHYSRSGLYNRQLSNLGYSHNIFNSSGSGRISRRRS